MTDETELLDFDELVATLSAWAGNRATVHIGPTKPPDHGPGMVWARMVGELHTSNEGRRWGPIAPEDPKRDQVAFQIAHNDQNYVVLYRQFFRKAWWVSHKHGFLIVEMTNIQIESRSRAEIALPGADHQRTPAATNGVGSKRRRPRISSR